MCIHTMDYMILKCVCDLFVCVYAPGTSVYSLTQKIFVELAQNLTGMVSDTSMFKPYMFL